MIGGVDAIFNVWIEPDEALDVCTRLITEHWPDAVLENAITGEQYAGYAGIPFKLVTELMVYRDRTAFESWQRLGADPSNADTMVHLLACGQGEVTAVVDDPLFAGTCELLQEMADRLGRTSAWSAWREAA